MVTRRWCSAESLAVLVLGLLVLAVHDVGYLLRQPFWTDEAWVAVTARFPLSQLPATTSSTPIGWSALMRVVTVSGTQTARLLPLGFAGAAVIIAYWFARRLGWPWRAASVTAGLLAGIGVLLAPAMLVRNDLKQYTADACMALLTLALTSQLEREWSRWRLAGLSVSVWGGMLLSHTVAFVGLAAFGAVCAVQLARRAWRRLAEAVVTGTVTAVLMLGVYEGFDARAVVPGLTAYWADYYLPVSQGLGASSTFVISRVNAVHAHAGLGPAWLGIALFIAGLVTIFRLGRPATAIAVTALWPEMLVLSALKKYPFLDVRTSTFLFAITVVVAAIGIAGLGLLVRPWLRGGVAAMLAAAAAVAFIIGAQPYVRIHSIVREDVRDQARYIAAHAAPGDVILVNLTSNWGFAYYWPAARQPAAPIPLFCRDTRHISRGSHASSSREPGTARASARRCPWPWRGPGSMLAPGSGWSVRTWGDPSGRRGPRHCASGDWSAWGSGSSGCGWCSLAVDQRAVPRGAQAGGRPGALAARPRGAGWAGWTPPRPGQISCARPGASGITWGRSSLLPPGSVAGSPGE